MRRSTIVADVTRMSGERVCVGGYLEDGAPMRPVCGRHGPTEAWLRPKSDELVVPFSIVALTVLGAPPILVAPHTEDRLVPDSGHRVSEVLTGQDALAHLEWSESPSVRDIFGADVHADPNGGWGRFVRAGEGRRSLGTVKAAAIRAVRYRYYSEHDRWDYRLHFVDASGEEFQLAVVALDFRRRLDAMRDGGVPSARIGPAVQASLQEQTVYLRIGLARGWDKHPDRCYLQVTGVYGFDDG